MLDRARRGGAVHLVTSVSLLIASWHQRFRSMEFPRLLPHCKEPRRQPPVVANNARMFGSTAPVRSFQPSSFCPSNRKRPNPSRRSSFSRLTFFALSTFGLLFPA